MSRFDNELATKIRNYWSERGFRSVKVEVVTAEDPHSPIIIKSNLVNGMPPGTKSRDLL